jgi:hypothetical protein
VRKTVTLVLVLFAVAYPFWGANESGTPGAPGGGISGAAAGMSAAQGAADALQNTPQFNIRFFDQKVYFLGDPIQLEVVITNTGTSTLRFKVANNRAFNLDFDVRTTTNVGLDHAKNFTIARNSDQPVFFREVSLEPSDRYSVVVDLASYAMFTSPGQYVLLATFYPDLFTGPGSNALKSNRLALNVKPAVVTAEEKALVQAETGAMLARSILPPDEVVGWTIGARQKSQWERFFLYLDLEALMRKNPDKDRSFRNATETSRRQMVDQFRLALRQMTIQQDISVIPTSYQILKTSYDSSDATVQVLEKFKYPDYTELKQYTYHLKKSDRYWIIYDYEIRNQGTE